MTVYQWRSLGLELGSAQRVLSTEVTQWGPWAFSSQYIEHLLNKTLNSLAVYFTDLWPSPVILSSFIPR